MKQLKLVFALLLLFLFGCIIKLSDKGETGIRFGTEMTFFSEASTTSSTAEAEIDFKPTSDLIQSLKNE